VREYKKIRFREPLPGFFIFSITLSILSRGKLNLPTFTFEWVIKDGKAYLGLERSL
jgi:hypothetical protein